MRDGQLSRRQLLLGLHAALASGALVLGGLGTRNDGSLVPAASVAHANEDDPSELPLLVLFWMQGGWDTLMSLDPRDHTQAPFNQRDNAVYTGYDKIAPHHAFFDAGMQESNNTGILTPSGSNIGFGLTMKPLLEHVEELCVVRGMDMGTLGHIVGKRYMLTGKFPRGVTASGSSIPTYWANAHAAKFAMPNLVFNVETFNEGLNPRASGVAMRDVGDLSSVLRRLAPEREPRVGLNQALANFHYQRDCLDEQLDIGGRIEAHQAAFEQARLLASGKLFPAFDFGKNPLPGGEIAGLYDAFGIDTGNFEGEMKKPKMMAALAAQALRKGLSQCVSVRLVGYLDTHGDELLTQHPQRLYEGWQAVADFIRFMKTTLGSNGKPLWDRTTMVCASEFARTPAMNQGYGRDHFPYSGAVIAGPNIVGNRVIGATSDDAYAGMPIDPKTGTPKEDGEIVRPPDVWATVLESAGMEHEILSNQEPKPIEAMLKSKS